MRAREKDRRIEFTPDAEGHAAALEAGQRSKLFDGIERQLAREPTRETRNRKLMRQNPVASRRVRIGALRVYYDSTRPHAS